MRHLGLLASEFPTLRGEARRCYDKIQSLLLGKTLLAEQDLRKWEKELKSIPVKIL